MRFFAFAALLLALPHITLGSHSDRCPCIGNHSSEKAVKTLEHNGLCPNRFGLGCNTHDINASCAVHIYESETAAQLKCGPSNSGESPWCETEWCYVDPQNCNLDFEWGVLGQAYSYATCGNLRQGTAEFSKSRWPYFWRVILSGSSTQRALWKGATWEIPVAAKSINTRKTGIAKVA